MLIILVLALVVLGPEKLPDAMRRIGRAYAELRRMGTGFTREFRDALEEPARDVRRMAEETSATIDGALRPDEPTGTAAGNGAPVDPPVDPTADGGSDGGGTRT